MDGEPGPNGQSPVSSGSPEGLINSAGTVALEGPSGSVSGAARLQTEIQQGEEVLVNMTPKERKALARDISQAFNASHQVGDTHELDPKTRAVVLDMLDIVGGVIAEKDEAAA